MKKISLTLLLLLALSLVMSSCEIVTDVIFKIREPETALDVWENVSTKMGMLSSYESHLTIELKEQTDGVSTKIIEHGVTAENYVYSASRYSMTFPDGTVRVKESTCAYDEGKIYLLNSLDGDYSRFSSSIPFSDFKSYYYERATSILSTEYLKDAFSSSFTQNEDSTWTIVFEDFARHAASEMASNLSLDSILSETATDAYVQIDADERFRADKITVKLIGNDAGEPLVTIVNTYANHNAAKKVDFNKDNFTEIEDVRIITDVLDTVNARLHDQNGGFTAEITQKKTNANGYITLAEAKYDVSFTCGHDGGGYSFDMDVTAANNAKITASYRDGILTQSNGAVSYPIRMTDGEARALIRELATNAVAGYSPHMLTDIIKQSDGSYKMFAKIGDEQTLAAMALEAQLGAYVKNEAIFTVSVEDGEIVRIEAHVSVYGTASVLTIDSYLSFEENDGGNAENGGTQV